jgi:hypothetical protein
MLEIVGACSFSVFCLTFVLIPFRRLVYAVGESLPDDRIVSAAVRGIGVGYPFQKFIWLSG